MKIHKITLKATYIGIVLFSAGLMGFFSETFAQNVPWIQKADMPTGRHGYAVGAVNGKIYVAGGRYTLNLLNVYDPATDTWITKASMPTARMVSSGCAVNGKFYVLGGVMAAFQVALSRVEEYNLSTDTWSAKSPMPTRRLGLGTSVVGGKIYAIGGMTSGSSFWQGMQNCVEVYDPETDSWSTGSSMPTKRCWFTTSVVNGKIYAIGGALVTKQPLSVVEAYDPATDTWTTKASMPTARMGHAAAVVDGIIYVLGGGTENGQPVGGYSVVEAYDPESDVWIEKADIPVPRSSMSAVELDGKIYVIGGISNFANPHLTGEKTVYVYDPAKDLTELIKKFSINKCFAQAGNDSICIKTKLNDPTGVTLVAEIQAPDQTAVETLQLFDDGNHHDGNAGDSLYANIWPLISDEERQYYVDLQVTQVDTNTVIHRMNNLASFTTIGPVVFESYSFDNEPNPGDRMGIKLTLKNSGSTGTATNIQAQLTSLDSLVDVSGDMRPFEDIMPGEMIENIGFYIFNISENCPDNAEIHFALDIISNNYTFWRDTFSIFIGHSPTKIIPKENLVRQFHLNQNYPNPFNPATTIQFSIPQQDFVTLKVFDCLGRELKTLVESYLNAGTHLVNFDASNLASGLYYYQLHAGNLTETKKMLLVR